MGMKISAPEPEAAALEDSWEALAQELYNEFIYECNGDVLGECHKCSYRATDEQNPQTYKCGAPKIFAGRMAALRGEQATK